ncbi:MAG: DUF2252 family protein, partial [Methylococcales bacterium]
FYRGSCHLFYEDIAAQGAALNNCPDTWLCGDLHLENFGSYKADNRQVYFDMNDFDESVLGPCLLDICRLTVSLLLADEIIESQAHALQLVTHFLDTYAKTLQAGKISYLETATATGLIKDFLEHSAARKRADFIDRYTEKEDGKRKLQVDDKRIKKIDKSSKEAIIHSIEQWANQHENPDFFKVLDVDCRLAGTGSLGLQRYILLIEGKGKDAHYLLDMKIAKPSCHTSYLKTAQPKWSNQAERIISSQQYLLSAPPALLSSIKHDEQWFVIKELQPSQDKMDISLCTDKPAKLLEIVSSLAKLTAWAQLRSGGRQASATVDQLQTFAHDDSRWQKDVLDYSSHYATEVQKNYKSYCEAYKDGFF